MNLLFAYFFHQNFVLNIVETQLIDDISNPDGSLTTIGSQIRSLNILFLGVFVIELLMNIAANWWRRFLRSPWNLLDVAMVTSGVLSTFSLHMVVLRLLRIARVLRIFGKVRVLREIISALASSLIPMASAFFILVVMMCMCECIN
jgi:voltage-gated sodium channel